MASSLHVISPAIEQEESVLNSEGGRGNLPIGQPLGQILVILKEDSKMAPARTGSSSGSDRVGLRLGPGRAPAQAGSGSGSRVNIPSLIWTIGELK